MRGPQVVVVVVHADGQIPEGLARVPGRPGVGADGRIGIVGVELGHRRSVALAQSAQFSQQAINRPCFARFAPVQVGE